MAIKYWTGNVSTDVSNIANWRGGVLPASGDDVFFNGDTAKNCCDGDMTRGSTVFLNTVKVDKEFWAKWRLGRPSQDLSVSMKVFSIEACRVRIYPDEPGDLQNFYVNFIEPTGSDENISLTITESYQLCAGGKTVRGEPEMVRHRYIFKGYVQKVTFKTMLGHDPTIDHQGCSDCYLFRGPSIQWAEDLAATVKTGFEDFIIDGSAYETDPGSSSGLEKWMQLGPWGTNPANVRSITIRSWDCTKTYIEDLGNLTMDCDNWQNVESTCQIFNKEWIPGDGADWTCDTEGQNSTYRQDSYTIPSNATRATGTLTFGAVPADGELCVISDGVNARTFIVETDATAITGEADSSNRILVSTNGMTTTAEIASEFMRAIAEVNVHDQKTYGAGAGTANLQLNIYAYIDLHTTNTHVVKLRNFSGGTAGNVSITETFGNVANVVAGMSGGAATVGDQYQLPVKIDTLKIDAVQEKFDGRKVGFSEKGRVYIHVPSEIARLELSGFSVGDEHHASLIYSPIGFEESHIIHDGFMNGGLIDMEHTHYRNMVIDNGTVTTPSGGIQWQGSANYGTILWPELCQVYLDAADITEDNPGG